jgi:hypothetical protein
MKLSILMIASMAGVGPASAFVTPPTQTHRNNVHTLSAVDTAMAVDPTYVIASVGAAVSAIGGAFVAFGKKTGGTTASTTEIPAVIAEPEVIDVSIPYAAKALLAYNAYTKSSSTEVDFKEFQSLYYEQMVAEVKATVQERKVDEMKAVLADMENEASAIKGQIDALFGVAAAAEPSVTKVEATSVIPANDVDLSIDYNAPAKLAYASSDKSMDFESYRKVYEADTVAMVSAKNPYKK